MGTPGSQAFEAIDELVVTLGSGNNPQGQGGGVVGGTSGSAGAKICQIGTQAIGGNEGNGAGHIIRGWVAAGGRG